MAKKSPGVILKKKGLIPETWDLRSLSRGQKSWITKQAKTYKDVVKRPADFATVKIKGKRQKLEAKSAGFPVTNKRALVYTKGGTARRVKSGSIVIHEPSGRRLDVSFAASKDFLKAIDKARKRKLKRNQVWGIMVGGRLAHAQYPNFEDLMLYVNAHEEWEHSSETMQYVSIALVTEGRASVVAHNRFGEDDGE